jgi:selenoprotein W-related protein
VTGDRQKPAVSIRYCTQCNWLLRSAWLAQELLQTFGQELGSVALEPGTGGIFEISVDGVLVWERKVLKQRVRDAAFPERDLGHSDRTPR